MDDVGSREGVRGCQLWGRMHRRAGIILEAKDGGWLRSSTFLNSIP